MDNTRPCVFLSAGVPEKILADGQPDASPYVLTAEPHLIREAVLALVVVCHECRLGLVFGGHPAISPLVHHAAERLQMVPDVEIYQSRFFLKYPEIVPPAAWKFPNLHETPDEGNLDDSVAALRDQMIDSRTHAFHAGVFIGGKKGIVDEFNRFGRHYRGVLRIPLHSTGGASRELFLDNRASYLQTPLERDELPIPQRLPYKELFRTYLLPAFLRPPKG